MAQRFKRSAITVLPDDGTFLTADEIVKRAVQQKLLNPDKMTEAPERTMSAVLSNNIQQRGSDSEFVRRDDRFGLNPERRPAVGARRRGPADGTGATPDAPDQASLNGRAGEYSVVSELLFCGFDACVANVDEGTDVFAVKGGRRFSIQVKTSALVRKKRSFFILPGAHKRFNHPDAYYAFVMRSGICNDFLVMPYHEVQRQMESGRIGKMNDKYHAVFAWGDKITLDGTDVTYYRRRWPQA